ncbi:hypothetical protein BJV82DRAFT_712487 [Fennellomyces sp. T-0311]|nr:hypothetical protein BJV82DRAFT_712487 [Fennellomyces sp. T-0311]
MSTFIDNPIHLFQEHTTGGPAPFAPECPTTFALAWPAFQAWNRSQENEFVLKFIDRTSGEYRKEGARNDQFIASTPAKQDGLPKETLVQAGISLPSLRGTFYKVVNIKYHWIHQGHQPNSIADMRSAPISRETKEIIEQLVERDLTWTTIKNMIRLDKARLGAILSRDFTNVPHVLRTSYQEVYYAMTKILQENGHWTSKNLSSYQEGMFLFAFMSDWQLTVLNLDGNIISDTCKTKVKSFILRIKRSILQITNFYDSLCHLNIALDPGLISKVMLKDPRVVELILTTFVDEFPDL